MTTQGRPHHQTTPPMRAETSSWLPAMRVEANLTETQQYGRGWLVVSDGKMQVYGAPDGFVEHQLMELGIGARPLLPHGSPPKIRSSRR